MKATSSGIEKGTGVKLHYYPETEALPLHPVRIGRAVAPGFGTPRARNGR